MKHSTKSPTKAQQHRFELLQEIGCLACQIRGLGHNPVDIQHILSGGKRMGHDYTIGLCPYHHRSVVPTGFTESKVKEVMGPSMAKNPKEFEMEFGTQMELLEFQNEAIKIAEQNYI